MMYKTSNYVKLVAFALVGLFMFSCNHDDEEPVGTLISNLIDFKLQNTQGENLFDPSVKGHYNVDDMKLFYLREGGKVELAKIDGGANPYIHVRLYERDKSLELPTHIERIKLVRKIDAETSIFENTAYLQLTENDTDTIVSHMLYHQKKLLKSYRVKKAWYNGQLFWEREKGQIANIVKSQNN